jgi:GNAT superfamily N-acetyltransferase
VIEATLTIVGSELPAGFNTLRTEARAEGYRFLERLCVEWASGTIQFDRPGERLMTARVAGELVAIGGLTVDPVVAGALRMRRFYVSARFRRHGIGRTLASALLGHALRSTDLVTVNAATGSAPFWETLGFVAEPRDGHSHVLVRGRHLAVSPSMLG